MYIYVRVHINTYLTHLRCPQRDEFLQINAPGKHHPDRTVHFLLHPFPVPKTALSLTSSTAPALPDPELRVCGLTPEAPAWCVASHSLLRPSYPCHFVSFWLYSILFFKQSTTYPPRIHICNEQPAEAASLYCLAGCGHGAKWAGREGMSALL